MSQKYDIIIVGAGIGGLTAGAILSRNGLKILILEKNPVTGGYVVCFKRKGFEFDSALHLMNGCNAGGRTYEILKACGIEKKIKFLKPTHLYRAVFPSHDISVSQCNINKHIKALQTNFPDEKNAIRNFFLEVQRIYNEIYNFDRFGKLSPEFIKSVKTTCDVFLDSFFSDPKLKAVIFQLWPYFGLPPSQLPVFYFVYPWFDYLLNGGFYPAGGSKAISSALVDTIKSNGGNVLLSSPVNKIITKKLVACGVVTESGERFFADAIISNIDARLTYLKLLGGSKLPRDFLKKLGQMTPSISAFQVYLGLNIDVKKTGISDFDIFYNPNYDIETQYRDCLEHKISNPALGIIVYTNLEKSFTAPQKSIVVLTAFSNYDYWKKIKKHDYDKTKKHFARTMIKAAQTIIPNLSQYIEIQSLASPITMERYTGSYKGAIYGWSQNLQQSGIMRLDKKTPIKNLYLTGAWTRPGGGVTGVMYSGRAVANDIIKAFKT